MFNEPRRWSDGARRNTQRSPKASIALMATLALCACQPSAPANSTQHSTMANNEHQMVRFDVNLRSYLDRPIFDVHLNGVDIGVAGGPPHTGNGAVMTGVLVPLGPQVVSWRLDGPKGMPGNGETVRSVNRPVLARPSQEMRYLGVHIYPDNTVELIPEPYWPERTERGEALNRAWEKQHAQ